MERAMMEWALAYALMGWPVFPCRPGEKIPMTKNGHNDATTDQAAIRYWWKQWPDANIGFAVPEGFSVVDVDIKPDEGKHGDETLKALEAQHGELPDTVRSLTGGGGVQHFFRTDTTLTCKNGLFDSIDLKTKGGYVILPPSLHPNGRRYEWELGHAPGEIDGATLPQWIVDARTNEKKPPKVNQTKELPPPTVFEGQRNEILFKLASSLRARGLTEEAILAALRVENAKRCAPPLPDDEVAKLTHSAGKYEQGEVASEWEKPIPFTEITTPDFPTDALPEPMAAFVDALSISTQTPNEMGAILSLGVLATAFQRRYTVQVTPDWKEQLSLYTVAVAPPGERKTAVIGSLMAPVYSYEATRRDFEAVEIAQNQSEKAMLEKALSVAQTNAAKAKDAQAMEWGREKVRDLSAQLAEFKEMVPFRLVVDDTTPEKLIDIMDVREGCMTISSAEGGIFDALSGRYDKGANFDIYLKGHAGDPISVERIGRSPNYIPNPRLTMMLTIQPEVLNGLMGNATFKGRGLCGRFLYAICKSKVGRREVNPAPVPEAVREAYGQFVKRLLSGQGEGVIYLSPEADRLRIEYAAHVERRLGNEWEFIRDWGGKLVGAMIRIAGLLHAADSNGFPTREPISADEMARAIRIAEFLGPHAEAAYQVMGADERQESAKYLLRRMLEIGKDSISKRDLFAACQTHFGKSENMTAPLQKLEEMGYIRMTETQTGGRPSKIILLNPLAKGTEGTKAS